MSGISDAEMFEWAETQRALASGMSNHALANALLSNVYGSVCTVETEHTCDDEDSRRFELQKGMLREAAFRLAGIRDYEALDASDK